MARPATFLLAALDVLLLLVIAGCGGSSMTANTRMMQSIMVTPASADAQNFANAQVQFTATATFNMAPMTVTSPSVLWSVGNPSFMSATPTPMSMSMGTSAASTGPSITANGLAQCNGFTGIVTIEATAPADPGIPISQMNSMMRTVSGMAQMTCP